MPQGILTLVDTNRAVENIKFDFEDFIRNELGLHIDGSTPSKSNEASGVCNFFLRGHCWKGSNCQYRHLTPQENMQEKHQRNVQNRMQDRAVVCKHWLRGLCKKGEQCEFLHEYNMKKMPECWFYTKNGECSNGDECIYQHIDPESRVKECAWYARGFCKHGPKCRNKHVRRIICKQYMFGFCPKGPTCPNSHPSFELPISNDAQADGQQEFAQDGNQNRVQQSSFQNSSQLSGQQAPGYRPLEEVTCFKCNAMGHYANKCPNSKSGPIIPTIKPIQNK
ncbi:Cleavage and polyadenylation specificity factor subunit 4 [Mycoemilia scoparia]|uniref:mRNA 3'-end-processing protein n=1 Tax=Mycoemilia scoparia TaxID=417184 RepID=A0A9W8A317_9FUNG|nr:Cleavage and polyadenylation specificity factor subunit 4 [Mycoemilia scoparia]